MSKSIFNLYETDPKLEAETGIIFDMLEYGRFRLRRTGGANKAYGKLLLERMKPYRRQYDNDQMDDEVARKIAIEVFCKTILIGWEGVAGPDGNTYPYSYDNAVSLLLARNDLYLDLKGEADRAANFKAEERKTDAKNSEIVSAGILSTETN